MSPRFLIKTFNYETLHYLNTFKIRTVWTLQIDLIV